MTASTTPVQLRTVTWGDSTGNFHNGPFVDSLAQQYGTAGAFGSQGGVPLPSGQNPLGEGVIAHSGSTTPIDGGPANGGVGYAYDYTRFPTGIGYAISPGGCVTYGQGGGNFTGNHFAIYYVKESDAGSITMNLNNNGAGWVGQATTNAFSATPVGGILATTTYNGVNPYELQVCASGSGPIYVWDVSYENDLANGVINFNMARGGLSLDDMVSTPTSITTPWYASFNPDLVAFEMKNNNVNPDGLTYPSGHTYQQDINTYVADWQAANPLTDFLWFGSNPTLNGSVALSLENQILENTASSTNSVYWDGYNPILNYATEKALGWITDASSPHQTSLGQATEFNMMWSDLGFDSIWNSTSTKAINSPNIKTQNLTIFTPLSGSSDTATLNFSSNNVGPNGLTTIPAHISVSSWNAPGISFYPSRDFAGYGYSFDSFGGTSRMYIDANTGKVGIGSSTPYSLLAIQGQGSGTGVTFQTTDSNAVPKFTILDNGSVGIGTTTPGSLLSLAGIANFTAATSTFYGNGLNLTSGCFAVNGVCVGSGGSGTVNSGTTGQLSYYASNGTTVSGTSNIVMSGGNLGIGTTSPYAPLSVVGDLVVRNGSLKVSEDAAHAFQDFSIQSAYGNDIFGFQILGTGLNGHDWRLEEGRGTPGSIGFSDCSNTCNPTLTVGTNDNVGIATSAPKSLLTVAGNATIGLDYSNAGPTNGLAVEGSVGIGTTTPYAPLEVWSSSAAATTTAFAVVNNASTTAFAVYANGNATYSGSIFQSSDRGLKTNITPLDASSSLAAIIGLNPVSYTRIDQPGGGTNLGFLAQDVEQIFPELVTVTNPTPLTPGGTLTLNYIGLIAPIVEVVKELAGEVSGFAKSITTAVLNATTVNTSNLCVKKSDGSNVCITGDQLDSLLNKPSTASVSSASTANTPSCTLSASPTSVTPGDHVVLSWSFPDAGTFSIDQNVGSVSPALSGTTTSKAIDADTTFTGTGVSSVGGAVTTCVASVSVTTPPIVITDVVATSTIATSTPPVIPTATSTPPTVSDSANTASTTLSTTTPSQNNATSTP
ncbi:MAG: tail fiber domain-containing protein [Minisyncoccota bacterium]